MSLALSIRQPWAWLILHACKDVENRMWRTNVRGRVLIHATASMTLADYEGAALFCSALPEGTLPEDFWFPTREQCREKCGGIVGVMTIGDCVRASPSPWFSGPYGFVIESAAEMTFRPCRGALKFFDVTTQPPEQAKA